MKYQVGEFELNTQTRTLTHENTSQNIRPKTMALLLYLIDRPGQIVSKEELLNSVWDDVTVDEGVVFQSVREIRKLFANNNIVQNHPRKGYEFTEAVKPVTPESVRPKSSITKLVIACLSVVSLVVLSLFVLLEEEPLSPYQQRILVLPVKNHIPYGDYNWLSLGGMEQIIANLRGLPDSTLVYQGEQVPTLLAQAGLKRNLNSSQISQLMTISGASLVIDTEVHGNASDYKVIYKLHAKTDTKQGVIVTHSIEQGFQDLAEKLAERINLPLAKTSREPKKEFSDALFAQAMIAYEEDWQTSVSFFESYLSLNPTSTVAAIYLSKLYLWQGHNDKALSLMTKAAALNEEKASLRAEVSLILGRIAAADKNGILAEQYFQQAQSQLNTHSDWLLKATIAEERGLALAARSLQEKAIESLLQALEYYHIVQSPIGINSTNLHLASMYFKSGDIKQGHQYFDVAKHDIQSKKIEFLYTMLNNYEKSLVNYLGD